MMLTCGPVQEHATSLWPFFMHHSSEVRRQTLQCFEAIAAAAFAHATASAAEIDANGFIRPLIHLSMQTLLLDSSDETCSACEQLLAGIAEACPASVLATALDTQTIQILAALCCTPAGMPVCGEHMRRPSFTSEAGQPGLQHAPMEHQQSLSGMAKQAIAADANSCEVFTRRIACARVLAALAQQCWRNKADAAACNAAQNLQNWMATLIMRGEATQQLFGALVLFFWSRLQTNHGLPSNMQQHVRHPD